MLSLIKQYIFTKTFIIPRMLLLIQLPVHDLIKTRPLRTVADLFYWPDGICWDMVLVYIFLVGCIHIVLNDLIQIRRIINQSEQED